VSALSLGASIAVGTVLVGSIAYYWFTTLQSAARRERAALRERARATRAHYAAVEAAEDDPIFSPDEIDRAVIEVVALADGLWRSQVIGTLDDRPDARLVRAWARSWQWLGDGLEVVAKPSIDLIGVVNRDDEDEDRIVLRVRLRIDCKYPKGGRLGPHHVHLDQRWTFRRSSTRWVLVSVSGDPLAGPVLTAPLIPNPSSDTDRLTDESLAELADRRKVGNDVALSDLVNADDPAAFALLDLSVVDNRFGPELIAAKLARLLEAWESAVSGSEGPLEEQASDSARDALLRPSFRTRLIVRDVVLKSWEATVLDLSRHPPTVEVNLDVAAVRYVVRNDGAAVAGNHTDPNQMRLTWVLELRDSVQDPWWLTMSNNPAKAIPGFP